MTAPNTPRRNTSALCAELLEVLEDELRAIISHDGQRLQQLHQAKLALVRSLEQPPVDHGELTAEEKSTLGQCRARNQRNGTLLEMRRRHADRALQILHHIPDAGAIYDGTGATHVLATSRYQTSA